MHYYGKSYMLFLYHRQIGKSYVGAMTGAVGVSVIANKLVKVTSLYTHSIALVYCTLLTGSSATGG